MLLYLGFAVTCRDTAIHRVVRLSSLVHWEWIALRDMGLDNLSAALEMLKNAWRYIRTSSQTHGCKLGCSILEESWTLLLYIYLWQILKIYFSTLSRAAFLDSKCVQKNSCILLIKERRISLDCELLTVSHIY